MFELSYSKVDHRSQGALAIALQAQEQEKEQALLRGEYQETSRKNQASARRGLIVSILASLGLA
jgi:hypothetical protein